MIRIRQKVYRDMLCQTYVFPTDGSAGHVVHPGASRARNMIALFFMLGWDRYGFDKKRSRTRYVAVVFLHQVGCAGHIVYSGASGA
jgi:hypothetical protein